MVGRLRYLGNLALVDATLSNLALSDGAIIECGTWKKGWPLVLHHTRRGIVLRKHRVVPRDQNFASLLYSRTFVMAASADTLRVT